MSDFDTTSIAARFWSKVDRTEGCWLWTAPLSDGYGQLKVAGAPIKAHRVSWFLAKGAWPERFVIQTCGNRHCVNPLHLETANDVRRPKGRRRPTCSVCGGTDFSPSGFCRACSKKRSRIYRSTHREKCKEITSAWRQRNPQQGRLDAQNRRVRKDGGRLSRDIVERLLKLQRGKCACCGASLKNGYHIDHIVPLSLGGQHCDANVQLLAPKCNLEKAFKDPIDYMQSRGLLL